MPKKTRQAKNKQRGRSSPSGPEMPRREPVGLRIIGGRFRGRKLEYGGEGSVRPMKDRVREAVFNLIGPGVVGTYAIDLFAGTGALAIEAVSRGAVGATLIEWNAPTAAIIRHNLRALGLETPCKLLQTSAFLWAREAQVPGDAPWTVFCSPPYCFFVDRQDEMLHLLGSLMERAPAESIFVVESDALFDHDRLPRAEAWKRRSYPPAEVGVWYKPSVEDKS